MADTETHYIDYSAEELWREIHDAYTDAGGELLYPGDEKEMLLRAVQAVCMSICARVDSALRMDTLSYATGEYLKLYGEKRGCEYLEAQKAGVPVLIHFSANGVSQTLPAGTSFTADGRLIYETTEDIVLTGTDQTVSATLQCKSAGVAGNALASGTQMQIVSAANVIYSAVTTADASGGRDAEDEEDYRERIRDWGLATPTTGSKTAYETKAKAVSGSILDAEAISPEAGCVTVYLLPEEGADTSALIQAVTEALSAENARPLTDNVSVALSGSAPYTLNVKVYYALFSALSSAPEDVISEYQKWQDGAIGRAFNPDKLTAMLYQAGVDRVEYLSGSGMDGSMSYTEIDPDKHCAGTISLTVENS